jgi:hypothetical protein
MQKWEYKVVTFTLETKAETQEAALRKWGGEGWEVVTVAVVPRQALGLATIALLYLKRPVA